MVREELSWPPAVPISDRDTDIGALPRSASEARNGRCDDEDRYQDNNATAAAAAAATANRDYEQGQEQVAETTPFLGIERIGAGGAGGSSESPIGQRARILKAVLYGVQNFYAFMIM